MRGHFTQDPSYYTEIAGEGGVGGAFRREGRSDKPKDEFGRGERQRWSGRERDKTNKGRKRKLTGDVNIL